MQVLWRPRLGVGLIGVAVVAAPVGLVTGCGVDRPEPIGGPGDVLVANAVVDVVVDGDTIDVVVGGREERVRLIGIDTPEIAHDDGEVSECLGDEAATFAESLLPVGTAVRLVRDVESRDHYGRLLAYVYRASDGVLVNLELVRRGYAQPLSFEPNITHAPEIALAARDAEHDDLGLWASCRG